jgi:hypothetical protein
MNPETHDDDEPLLEGFEVPPEVWDSPPVAPEFREAVLARTSAALRARCRRRRVALVGALVAASYAGGITTAWVALQREPTTAKSEQVVTVAKQDPGRAATAEPAVTDTLLRDPEGFALLLDKSPVDEQVEILKVAGDRYLEGFGDIEQAMNCYRRLLSLQQSSAEMAMNVDDSWLLKSMKQARLQEVNHEDATT